MANKFTNNKKVKMISANLADACVYTKASRSGLSQEQMAGKKFGTSYTLYLPGTPKVVNGTTAEPGEVVEVPTEIVLDDDNVSVELSVWEKFGSIDDFQEQVAKPYAEGLCRQQEKNIINANIYKAAQAVVAAAPAYSVITKSAAALRNLAISGEIDMFLSPDVNGEIAESGLSKFNESTIAKKLYNDAYIGRYSGAEVLESPDLPEFTTPAEIPAATITLGDAVTDADSNALGFAEITKVTGTGLKAGLAYKAAGLKVRDANGIQTNSDYHVIIHSVNNAGTEGYISPLRITLDGKGYNNANAWVPTGTTTLTLVSLLAASTTYYVQSCRAKSGLVFDSYKFLDVPTAEEEEVASTGNRTLKMRKWGKAENLNSFMRIDAPYGAGVPDNRACVVCFVKKA